MGYVVDVSVVPGQPMITRCLHFDKMVLLIMVSDAKDASLRGEEPLTCGYKQYLECHWI